MSHADRRAKLRRIAKKQGVEGVLVTNFVNVTYLTGFTGDDSYLLLAVDGPDVLISDRRYSQQLEQECPELELAIRGPGSTILQSVDKAVAAARLGRLAIEAGSMTVRMHAALEKKLAKCEIVAADDLVEQLRVVKDRTEIEATRRACRMARRAFEVVRAQLTPEMTELEVANQLEFHTRRFGGKGLAFPPIVGVGPRAALPHGSPTPKRIGESGFTLIDWGANEGLYLSDLTRILVTAKISPKLRKLYGVVLKAQQAGIDAIRPGATCESVDQAARSVIADAGYGKKFGHGLGHGIGLEIHEAPRVSQGQKTVLGAGMIVTVEPGVYLPGWGGIRIVDDVLVTRVGYEVLTDVPKQLEECMVG